MTTKFQKLEDQLWQAANKLRVDSELSSNEYSTPVLGMIFLKYADYKFTTLAEKLSTLYEHFYESYADANVSVYAIPERRSVR